MTEIDFQIQTSEFYLKLKFDWSQNSDILILDRDAKSKSGSFSLRFVRVPIFYSSSDSLSKSLNFISLLANSLNVSSTCNFKEF